MGDGVSFWVDLDFLASLHDQLNSIHGQLQATTSTTSEYGGLLGDPRLADGLSDFFGDWSNYWSQLEGNLGAVLGWLAQAQQAYSATDQSVAQAASPNVDGAVAAGGPS